MDSSALNYIRLTPEKQILPFDCGDNDLNEFLTADAKNHSIELLSVTYLIENRDGIAAFFSVLNDKITHEQVETNSRWNRIRILLPHAKNSKSYPAVKLGRFAVDKKYQNQGLGTILLDYIKFFFIDKNKTGCRFITVDAYRQSLPFYEKNKFKYLTEKDKDEETRLMYYDLAALKGLFNG
jgi:GNAT superfamily N-acetyltransferase